MMNTLEDRIANRLTDAASRVDVTSEVGAVVRRAARRSASDAEGGRSQILTSAAAAAVVVAAIGGIAAISRGGGVATPGGNLQEEPGVVGPAIDNPPEWTGEFSPAWGSGRRHAPMAVAVIGRVGTDTIDDPITIRFGTDDTCGDAVEITVDGAPACGIESAEYSWLHLETSQALTIDGHADLDILVDVADSVGLAMPGGGAFDIAELPDGYEVVVEPTSLGVSLRNGIMALDGDVMVWNETSEHDPVVALARPGSAPLERIDINGASGWYRQTAGNVESVAWSPEPGVVFIIDVIDIDVTTEQLVDLADRVDALPEDEWIDRYDVSESYPGEFR